MIPAFARNFTPSSRIARRGEPIRHHFREFLRGHAGMGHHDQLYEIVLVKFRRCFDVALQHRLVRLRVRPFRMQRGHRLHTVERECHLDIHRLLNPKRAIVVEGRDALGGCDQIRAAGFSDPVDEIDYGLLGRRGIP